MKSDNDQILEIHQSWIDAERQGEVRSMLELCSNDIRFIPPDSPIINGKNAVRDVLEAGAGSIKDIEITDLNIEVSGNLAFKVASFVTHLQSSENGEVSRVRGNHLWILRKENSRWRILIVTWSLW